MMPKSFSEQCYRLLKRVPRGYVTTYRELAHALGCKAYRAVGNCMRLNPYAPIVPCHRVVTSDGSLGGYAFGLSAKIAILRREGIEVSKGKILDFEKKFFSLSKPSKKISRKRSK